MMRWRYDNFLLNSPKLIGTLVLLLVVSLSNTSYAHGETLGVALTAKYAVGEDSVAFQNHILPGQVGDNGDLDASTSELLRTYKSTLTGPDGAKASQDSPVLLFGNSEENGDDLLVIRKSLDDRGIPYEIVSDTLPERDVNTSFEDQDLLGRLRNWWSRVYVKPTKHEIYHGVTLAALKGVVVSSIWFAADGVNPWTASSLVTAMVLYETLFSTYIRTYDNVVGGLSRFQARANFRFNSRRSWIELGKRFGHSALMAYIWRSWGGPLGDAHSIQTLQGHMEVITNSLAKIPGHWLGAVKHNNLSRSASAWVGFPLYVLSTVLSNLDLFGVKLLHMAQIPPIAIGQMTVYQPSVPIVGLLGLYAGTAALIHWGPQHLFERYAKFMDRITQTMSDKIQMKVESTFSFAKTSVQAQKEKLSCLLLLQKPQPVEIIESTED